MIIPDLLIWMWPWHGQGRWSLFWRRMILVVGGVLLAILIVFGTPIAKFMIVGMPPQPLPTVSTQAASLQTWQPGIDIVGSLRPVNGADLATEVVEVVRLECCLLRACHGDSVTHPESVYMMSTGSILMGKPSLGAWAAYGLGTENQNMPAFVVMPDPAGWVKGGAPAWGNGFLPAAFEGGRGTRSTTTGDNESCVSAGLVSVITNLSSFFKPSGKSFIVKAQPKRASTGARSLI